MSVAHNQSWGRWIQWWPTAMGTRLGALAPCGRHARAPRVKTCLTSSWLHHLTVLSLPKTRGDSYRSDAGRACSSWNEKSPPELTCGPRRKAKTRLAGPRRANYCAKAHEDWRARDFKQRTIRVAEVNMHVVILVIPPSRICYLFCPGEVEPVRRISTTHRANSGFANITRRGHSEHNTIITYYVYISLPIWSRWSARPTTCINDTQRVNTPCSKRRLCKTQSCTKTCNCNKQFLHVSPFH